MALRLLALLCVVPLLLQGEIVAQPKSKLDPKNPKVKPEANPSANNENFIGTWKLTQKNAKHEEEITIRNEKGEWELKGIYKLEGKVVGSFHGSKFSVAKDGLLFSLVVDEKPPFDILPNTRGTLTSSDDKGKIRFTAALDKSNHSWERAYTRIAKSSGESATLPKEQPKIDPKSEPKSTGSYTEIAQLKGAHNACISPDGLTLYAVSLEPTLKSVIAYDIKKQEVVKRTKLESPDRIQLSADGKVLAVTNQLNFGKKDASNQILVYDTTTWEKIAEFEHLLVNQISISADGKRLASGSAGSEVGAAGKINVWDVPSKQIKFTTPTKTYLCMDLSKDGKTLVTNAFGPGKNQIGFIDVDSGGVKASIQGSAETLTISADGKLAVGSLGNKLTVFDVVAKAAKELPTQAPGGIGTLALLDSNKRVVISGAFSETQFVILDTGKIEKTLRIDPVKGEKVPPGGKLLQAIWVRVTPDSSLLLTVGMDRIARVWKLPYGDSSK